MMMMMMKEVTCQSTTLMMRYNLTKTFKPLYLFQRCHDVMFVIFLSSLSCWFSLLKLYNKPLFSEFQKLSLQNKAPAKPCPWKWVFLHENEKSFSYVLNGFALCFAFKQRLHATRKYDTIPSLLLNFWNFPVIPL